MITADVKVQGAPLGIVVHHFQGAILLKPAFPTTTEEKRIGLLKKVMSKINHIMLSKWIWPIGEECGPLPI